MNTYEMNCPFCPDSIKRVDVALENELCLFLQQRHKVLIGSGIIIPKSHRRTVFDLTRKEISATFSLLSKVKEYIDSIFQPDGYNCGWNSEQAAGQEVFHAHMHVIPRFDDEPLAGKGIRYWLKQEENIRHNNVVQTDEERLRL
jgi:histidine triad (HIT) family protein